MHLDRDRIYRFGGFELDPSERTLTKGSTIVSLAPRVFDTLLLLIKNHPRLVSKQTMMEVVWEGSFVEENNLAQNISFLRRLLGETRVNKFIETVPKLGYRFVAAVETINRPRMIVPSLTVEAESLRNVSPHSPETRYVQNNGVNIAYQTLGNGETDIVFVMGWISHLEFSWKHHLFASFLKRLASFSRLILFDKRGTGLSDRVPLSELPTLEQRMEDVHTVMDAVGSRRAVLVGVSEGGPMCSLFAATYPDRTAGLVMIGTYAKRIWSEDYPWAPTTKQREAFFAVMQRDWGKPVGIEERAPSMTSDPEFRDWWAEYLRMGASPGAAVALTKMNAEIDVREVLPSVRVPTLVIHRAGDECLKVEEGRFVASKIPASKFVVLPGNDHLPFVGDQEAILQEIEDFVGGLQGGEEHDRVLATVMNIRIADFAAEVRKRNKKAWTGLLKKSRKAVGGQLERFRGREVTYDENGVLATFDGPARAIRCALAINIAARKLELDLKTGLHTGECDVVDNIYSGVAVDLARRIADESINGNVLVSRTVKDLVAGSGLAFEEFGSRSFPNIEGEWRLFKVGLESGALE